MSAEVDDELWQEFHTVVNMTSRELEDWLRTRSADEDDEALPDQAGTPVLRGAAAKPGPDHQQQPIAHIDVGNEQRR